jgi:signal transduction histidine kinase
VNRPVTTALGWHLPSWLLDYGPVALIVAEGAIAIAVRPHPASAAILAVVLAATAVALILRHRAPLLVLAATLIAALAVGYGPVVMLPALFALFTVAEYRERSKAIIAAVVAAAALSVTPALHGAHEAPGAILSRFVAVGLAIAAGLYLRARADYVTGLHERAERLEREQELLAGQAVAEERVRIARELHDVVAHNVSLMVVQAQALAATATSDDAERKAALARVAGLGREALSEMHRMLGLLRLQNGGAAEREPQPGVRDLENLLAGTRQAGLEATLAVEGTPTELPPGVDLSAYRIVQEALTNVIRHAHAAHAEVTLRYGPRTLEVSVVDDGVGPGNGTSTGGHGLVGMRERVALFGGELEAGACSEGRGYRIHALLPLD